MLLHRHPVMLLVSICTYYQFIYIQNKLVENNVIQHSFSCGFHELLTILQRGSNINVDLVLPCTEVIASTKCKDFNDICNLHTLREFSMFYLLEQEFADSQNKIDRISINNKEAHKYVYILHGYSN